MALSDVTDALTDPDFCDPLQYIRQTVTMGVNGVGSVDEPVPTDFLACVVPGTGAVLKRTAEGEYVTDSITVYSQVELRPGQGSQTADIVIWKGARYTVTEVNSYMNFGQGFVEATCEIIPLRGAGS